MLAKPVAISLPNETVGKRKRARAEAVSERPPSWKATVEQLQAAFDAAVVEADRALREAAGNFYINDKPTGAVVGQQPFGGARGSGTNDKAGSVLNLIRWCSPRTIKETFSPSKSWRYPFLG